ncbi:hypothetical protein FRC17_006651 [Serendipita sp. 399]|nr:hypothetical protein FRC17_006651 [Serendipita sp. 399]
MAYILLAEYSTVRRDGTSYQLKEITIMCAVIVASLRDVLLSRAMDNAQTPLPPLFPDPSVCMIDVIAKLLSASRELNECVSEVGNLIKCILDLRTHFFPDPPIPQFPSQVLEEESQEDYGFDPIDINDPDLVEAMMVGQEGQVKPYWDEDFALAKAFCDLTTSITSVISRIAYLDKGSRKRKDTELWTEAWANIAILCTAHNLKQWDYFLRRTPRSLGRLDDLTWRQESEPMFLLHVLSGDPKSYYADREVFSRCWFLSMALDPQHSIPSYTFTLFHVDGLKSPIWEGIQFPRGMSEEDFEEVFVEQRLYLIQGVLHNLEGHYHASKDGANASVALVTEGVDGLLEMLTLMRYNVMEKAKAGNDNSLREYFEYCCEVVKILRDLDIGRDSRLSPLLADAWIDRASAWLRGE